MPIPLISSLFAHGATIAPFLIQALKFSPIAILIIFLKLYFGGASNHAERLMRSKVVLITGGTSGIGAAIAKDLAARGAQIILLTQYELGDPFLVDYLEDLRHGSNNELIYAEQADLSSLHSIRSFATKFIDNAPPRRLDAVIVCADTLNPRFGNKPLTTDGLDAVWQINYLANFHLLSILNPVIRAQPPDRDVRIIFASCASHVGGNLALLSDSNDPLPRGLKYETSKLASLTFAMAFQGLLDKSDRPDGQPNNARVVVVDPGYTRTPGMRRWLTMGTLWGLLIYLLTLPIWWLVLKSPSQGAQSFLHAIMEESFGRGAGGRYVKECRDIASLKPETRDAAVQQRLWTFSEKQIEKAERQSAARRKDKPESQSKDSSSRDNNPGSSVVKRRNV